MGNSHQGSCNKNLLIDENLFIRNGSFQVPADEVAASFAERSDVFLELSPESLKSKLDVLLQCDVDPASILRCKTTFRRSQKHIETLVRRLKDGGVEKILSYMISYPYPER